MPPGNIPAAIPTDYISGYEKARAIAPELADNYVAHTVVGDPVMDALLEEVASLSQREMNRFIRAGMEQERDVLRKAPEALRDFFLDPPPDPDWLDHDAFGAGVRGFQRNAPLVLAGFVAGVLIDGFATGISRSFMATGRIYDDGVRRLRQNNRHQMEIFFPGGLERHGDGWKLSVRIRFIHGQIRRLLALSEEWQPDDWGVPINSAHMSYSLACFSARSVAHASRLGARFSPEERAGIHHVWRYTGYLMGVPEAVIFRDESHALEIFRVGSMCEPPVSTDAIITTNALINSAPLVAGIEERAARQKLVNKTIYPVSRALVGKKLADELNFPKNRQVAPLLRFRLGQRLLSVKAKFDSNAPTNFTTLLSASAYDEAGIIYLLPDHAHAEKSRWW